MADIAFIFHWPLSEMDALAPDDLAQWWQLAAERWKTANPPAQ